MKLVKNIIFSILAFCITSNAFAQELSDKEIGLDVARISARLKERSVEEHYIQIEINRMRDMYKRMHIDQQNEEEYFFKKIKVDNTIKQARRISSEIPESERNALIDLYNSTGGANWTNTISGNRPWLVNDSNTPISGNWLGVGISNGHVVSINLNSNNLNGTLPASIGDLPFLTFISLNNNVLSGNIPSQIGLLSELTWLDLSRNRLSGSLPIEFYNLTKLWNLVLHNNNLNGNISSQIGQMTSLKIFSISVNSFSGVIPNEVGLLTNMISFQLDNNQFSGNIPLNLYQMTNLSSLNLASNQLVGNISPQISQLTSLRDLFLQVNNFSGELPSGIGQLSNLAHLWLNNNQFSGTVPTSYGSLTNLLNFSIHTNMLEGNIPSGFQNNTQLILFQISDNNFSGLLPDLSNNLFLSRLMIHNNRFRFVDFINSFPILKGRISSGAFGYSPQSKIDTPITIAKSVGQQATLKMCMDDRFHSGDTYQWFKDGLAIAGATSREYTIPAVALTDAGTYTCKSYHTSDPDMSPLILEREPIILNVLNCSPFVGSIVSYDLPEGQDYTCGNRSTFAYLDFDGSTYPSLNLDWTFLSPTGQILGTHSANSVADDSATFNFTIPGNNTIQLVVTEPNGCKTTLTNSILVNGCTTPCEEEIHFNFNFKVPFVNKGGILNNSERENIANGIGDFVNNNLQENIIFTTYDDHSSGVRTVAVQTNFATPVATATTNTSNETQIPGLLRFQDDFYNDTFSNVITNASNGITINPAITKKINISFFVITEDKFSDINAARVAYNELLATKANKVFFILMNEGRFRNTVNNALLTPQEFVSQVKNLNAIDFSSTNNVLTSDYVVYNRAQIIDVNFRATLSAFLQSALQKVKDDLCDKNCTTNNPKSQVVNQSLIGLINYLVTQKNNGASDASLNNSNPTYNAFLNLKPYITDSTPGIYNFQFQRSAGTDVIRFSFSPNHIDDIVYKGSTWVLPNNMSVNMDLFINPEQYIIHPATNTGVMNYADFNVRHINFCPQEIVNCTKTNPNSVIVNKLFVKLVQKLIALKISGIPDANINGISIPELTALAPFITDANPGIYNFVSNSNLSEIRFSFSRDEREYDVLVNGWQSAFVNQNDYQIDLSNYTGSSNYLQIANNTFNGISIKLTRVRHINFCPQEIVNCTKNNPRTQIVKNLFGALLTKLFSLNPSTITDGFTCPELTALAPYISDPNPAIYGYNINNTEQTVSFSFAKHDKVFPDVKLNTSVNNLPGLGAMTDVDVSSYISSEILLDRVPAYFQNGGGKIYIKHINFCPDDIVYCTTKNPRTSRVKELFGKLITHLKGLSSVPDGYNCNELDLLSHYITDKDARIYNFVAEPLSFSFHKPVDGDTIKHDVLISNWGNTSSALISDIDVTYFADANTFTNLDDKITFSDGSKARRAEVRHINFCPDDICVNHISLVIDESGSIDVYEKAKIKRQLKWFLKQQADVNDLYQGNMYISIVGMSDSDDLTKRRTDFIIPTRINNANLSTFTNWVNAYGNRYDVAPNDGISGGSDFWKSGLDKALEFNTPERKLNMVIMITDGSQAQDPEALKTTMLKFNNRSQHFEPFDPAKPHLYVVGINNGFYVGNNQTNTGLRQNEDPNYVPTLKSSSPNSRVTPALSLSLKYLLDLPEAEFPFNDISDFVKDYFGHNDFSFIGDELNEFYFSNKIKKAGISCRKETGKDTCEDCFSFQPIPTKWYVLNAWAKEELNVQVQKYNNPKIKLHFYDINENEIFDNIQDPSDDNNYPVIFEAKGEIIEGWQRIGNKFRVPYDAVFMEIELINEGNSVPVFFDDIRIYPIKGSMKSFVYDPETFRLMSELDENNYATYYEYDNEGGLVRIKKETVKGIKTIQETRSGNVIKVE